MKEPCCDKARVCPGCTREKHHLCSGCHGCGCLRSALIAAKSHGFPLDSKKKP